MNIFYIHENPTISAKAMSNKHVVKMILESAQLLSTAHHILDKSTSSELYKPTHKNHPSAIWVRQSYKNYQWLYNHFISLCEEYTKRYNKDLFKKSDVNCDMKSGKFYENEVKQK
jgi:hypothetical protein